MGVERAVGQPLQHLVDGGQGGARIFDDSPVGEQRRAGDAVGMLPASDVMEIAEALAAQGGGAAAASTGLDVLTLLRA